MDPYEVLDVDAGLDAAQLKARHRELVRANHPDHFPQGSPEAAAAQARVAEINLAYRLLTHPDELARHRAMLRRTEAARGAAPTAGPRPEAGPDHATGGARDGTPTEGDPTGAAFDYRAAARAEFRNVVETNPVTEFWTASGKSGRRRFGRGEPSRRRFRR